MTTVEQGSDIELAASSDSESEDSQFGVVGLFGLLAGLAVLGWFSPWGLVMVLAIVFIIFLHELAHYVTARRTGMKVTEFFIGFGPVIWSFRKGETRYGVKAIWAGAYVKIIGLTSSEEVAPEDEHRTYRSKGTWQRLWVITAGSAMHFTLALVMFFVLFLGYGVPNNDFDLALWEVNEVTDGSAAASAGLLTGDKIIEIDGIAIGDWDELVEMVQDRPAQRVSLLVDRDGTEVLTSTLLGEREGNGFLGVSPSFAMPLPDNVSFVGAGTESIRTERELMWLSLDGIRQFFTPSNLRDFSERVFSSPNSDTSELSLESRPVSIVGIVQVGAEGASQSAWNIIWLLAYFNVFIGVFNLLPLLPLDGGHAVIAIYEALRSRMGGKRHMVDIEKLVPLIYGVLAILLFFGLGAVYLDISDSILGN